MNNLFSVFDPSWAPLGAHWAAVGLVLMTPSYFWGSSSPSLHILYTTSSTLSLEIKTAIIYQGTPRLMLVSLFIFIASMNFLGLLPYVFTPSSHPSITLPLALPMWAGFTAWNILKNTGSALAHLVPEGTPVVLVPLMVVIEVVSNIIRPLTLSVRLAANMMAGHLLLVLVSSPIPAASVVLFLSSVMGLVFLSVLELAVGAIQAYVFCTLTSLYLKDASSPNN